MSAARTDKTIAARTARRRVITTVHARRAGSLDGMLALQQRASSDGSLHEVLGAVAEGVAALLGVDVCSIYLRDEGDELVLAATHGFPLHAVGQVRMRVGEGLTGFAVECLRPVSVATAAVDARNKRFAALPEERYPALCALPLCDAGRAVGALVVQRREARAFGERELVLIAAMAPVVLFAVERARRKRSEAAGPGEMPRSQRVASLAVRGAPGAPGRALGTVEVQRAPLPNPDGRAFDAALEREKLERAFAVMAEEVASLDAWGRRRLEEGHDGVRPPDAREARCARALLVALRFVIDDARLKQRARRHLETGASAAAAVERVAREYARVLGASDDEALQERALELEALCTRMLARLAGPAKAPAPGRVLVAARLTTFDAIDLARHHGAAAVLSMPQDASPGLAVARALGLPVVCDVTGLFRWAHDGDRCLVDGARGTLLLNPPRSEVAALRRDRRNGVT